MLGSKIVTMEVAGSDTVTCSQGGQGSSGREESGAEWWGGVSNSRRVLWEGLKFKVSLSYAVKSPSPNINLSVSGSINQINKRPAYFTFTGRFLCVRHI